MNILSDYAAHKRDEEWDRQHEQFWDEVFSSTARCIIHRQAFVAGCSSNTGFHAFPQGGGCSTCFWEGEGR